nr:MAG TPA: hypothetical protein [Caudoviricetes sp.]
MRGNKKARVVKRRLAVVIIKNPDRFRSGLCNNSLCVRYALKPQLT